jgi:hypothetical protein
VFPVRDDVAEEGVIGMPRGITVRSARPGLPPIGPRDLRPLLDQWVAEGLISAEQAARISAAQAAAVGASPVGDRGGGGATSAHGALTPGRVGFVVEALGYLGATLASVAGFVAVRRLWPDVPTAAELGFATAGAVVLLGAGVMLHPGADAALDRLRSVLWALSTGCVAALTALLADQVWQIENGTAVALLAASVTSVYAAILWLRLRAAIQHLVLFAALVSAVGSGAGLLEDDLQPWAPGLAVWTLSAAWAAAALRNLLAPSAAARVAASVGLLFGAQLTMESETAAATVLALGTVGGLLTGGVVLRKVWLLGVGALGVVQVVPQVAARYLPESVAAPLAVFAVGLVLLGVALRLARSRGLEHARPPDD